MPSDVAYFFTDLSHTASAGLHLWQGSVWIITDNDLNIHTITIQHGNDLVYVTGRAKTRACGHKLHLITLLVISQ